MEQMSRSNSWAHICSKLLIIQLQIIQLALSMSDFYLVLLCVYVYV
jgi:hypothetical protein